MAAGRRFRFAAAALLCAALVHVAVAKDLDPAKQRDEQKKVQARIEEASRRASSTIDAMTYQRLSPQPCSASASATAARSFSRSTLIGLNTMPARRVSAGCGIRRT